MNDRPMLNYDQWVRCSDTTIDRLLLECRADEGVAQRAPDRNGFYVMTFREPWAFICNLLTIPFRTECVMVTTDKNATMVHYLSRWQLAVLRSEILTWRARLLYRFHWLAPLREEEKPA